jgi:hypothetical protein
MWTARPHSGFELDTGAIKLVVTDQRDRNCGWVWHAIAEHAYGSDALGQCGGFDSSDAAKVAACDWTRAFCLKSLAGISERPTKGGPTEMFPDAPYCKPDQSCCDFCCGN